MRARILLSSALAMLAITPAPAAAIQEPSDRERPHFDSRRGDRATVAERSERARTVLARRLGAEASVDGDPVGGGARSIGRTNGLLADPKPGDAEDIALSYMRANAAVLGFDSADLDALRLGARYTSPNGVTHLTWQQTSRGLPSYDGLVTVNVAADGSIVNLTGAAVHDLALAGVTPSLSAAQALAVARRDVGAPAGAARGRASAGAERRTRFANGDSARLVAFADPDGDRLAWRLTVAGEAPYVYDEVVDAHSGRVLARHSLTQFVSSAMVFDNHPGAPGPSGAAHTVDLAADPQWMNRSSLTVPSSLDGRNAHTYADVGGPNGFTPGEDIAPSASTNWLYAQASVGCAPGTPSVFSAICTWSGDTTTRAGEPTNRAQTTTQLHYFVNTFRDWLAAAPVGFTDASHNFEVGGTSGSDPVLAEADDSAGFNNANMSTPSDGLSPRMQMYLFANPAVSSADDASIVYHEYTHGLSNRLVNNGFGGGLIAEQSRAMGEGWSDWFAMDQLVAQGHVTDTAADGDIRLGEYATNNTVRGIRKNALDCRVSSTNAAACPGNTTVGAGGWTFDEMGYIGSYGTVGGDRYSRFEVHDEGELWAATLWDLRTALGGSVTRGLVAEAMRLSPANPSFLDERDAILQADQVTGGTRHAQIWAVFAARGMGYGARVAGPDATRATAAFDLPPALLATAQLSSLHEPPPLGDGDQRAEGGETVQLRVRLRNPATTPLTGVRATLTTAAAGATVGQPTAVYPNIGARASDLADIPFALSIPSALPCTSIALSLSVHADQGNVSLPLTLELGNRSGASFAATSALPVAIPDRQANGVIPTGPTVTVNVPAAGNADHARVTLSTNHTFVGDLHARLTAPDGTAVELFERPGESFLGAGIAGFNAVVFSDDAPTAIQNLPGYAGGPLLPAIGGTFQPNEPLARLDGHSQQGDWKLRVFDAQNLQSGSITALSIQPQAGPAVCATTAPAPPLVVTTAPASDIAATTATLNGILDPGPAATDYHFEFGRTTAYGRSTSPATAAAGSGGAPRSAVVSGLALGTYHYRLVASRSGTVVALSPDATFTTLPPPGVTTGSGTEPPPPPPLVPLAPPPPPPPPVSVTRPPSVTRLPSVVSIDRFGRFTLAFAAKPAGLRGTVALKTVARPGGKPIALGSRAFRTSSSGRVRIALRLGRTTLLRLRRLKSIPRATALVTLGGRSFRVTCRLQLRR